MNLKQFVTASILSALIVVMSIVPYTGYISYGLVEITTLHIVVILGACMLGTKYGALLGLVWGITCLIRAYVTVIFLPFGFGNPLVSVVPRILVGAVAGAAFAWLKKTRLRRTVALSVSAILGTLTNTVLVLSAMSVFCGNTLADTITSIIKTLIGVNGSIELVAAIIIVPAIYFALAPRETALGIDLGASTTKLALVQNGRCINAIKKADDESLDEALDRLGIGGVSRIAVTGVGASFLTGDIRGIPTTKVDEFTSLYRGAAKCSGKPNCLVVSVGTGTSFVRVTPIRAWHVGGTGIGGGLLKGLSERLLGVSDVNELMALAKEGRLENVDLLLRDVCSGTISNLQPDSTVANLSKLSTASRADTALGILNLTFQSIGVMAAFAVQKHMTRSVVLVGTITDMPIASEILNPVAALHNVAFIIPVYAPFVTAIGAALE